MIDTKAILVNYCILSDVLCQSGVRKTAEKGGIFDGQCGGNRS